jgi:uncharacterized protein with FMN-binding domain
MRRAVIATAATVIGLVALLDYKSSGAVSTSSSRVKVNVGTSGQGASPASSTTAAGGSSARTAATTFSGTFTSPRVDYIYGEIQVSVTGKDGKVTAVSVPTNDATDPHSSAINDQAVPILVKEALAAQSVNIDVVSGATFTSEAFGRALKDALTKAHQ